MGWVGVSASYFFITNRHELSVLKLTYFTILMVSVAQESECGLTGGFGSHQAEL